MIPAALENVIYGLVSTPALYLADKPGIFRHLIDNGPSDSATLAGRLGVDQDTTQRLLLVLVASSAGLWSRRALPAQLGGGW